MIKPHKTAIKLKPWGREIWFAYTDKYAGKILEVKKGHRYSLQYHEKKQETQYILEGKVKFTYGKDLKHLKTIKMKEGDKIDILPGEIHRLEALENSKIIEVSTPHLMDIVKLSDDYGRTGKGNDPKLDKKLSKLSEKLQKLNK
jgi:mannose-6-phosphate isomerase-like protein (cupin superfamily)